MENNLIDRETLGQFVDALIARKYPGQPTESLGNIREEAMKSLDDEIGLAIFGSLNGEQLAEINSILDETPDDDARISEFFKDAGINVQEKIAETFQAFGAKFVGGENE